MVHGDKAAAPADPKLSDTANNLLSFGIGAVAAPLFIGRAALKLVKDVACSPFNSLAQSVMRASSSLHKDPLSSRGFNNKAAVVGALVSTTVLVYAGYQYGIKPLMADPSATATMTAPVSAAQSPVAAASKASVPAAK
jgi:hypothetical protein